MTSPRVTKSMTITLTGTTILVGDLQDLLDGTPRTARISIDYTDFSGSRDPREIDIETLGALLTELFAIEETP